jgi:hypothetical protein
MGHRLPESRQRMMIAARKYLKGNEILNGTTIAIWRVPVMYRLLDRIPDSPKHSRHPARATANEAALKRDEPAGKSAVGTVDITTVHATIGRPVASAGRQKPLRMEWLLCVFGNSEWQMRKMFRSVDLPAGVVGCSIRFAYQAADAGHPEGAEQARRRARKLRRQVQTLPGCRRRKLP